MEHLFHPWHWAPVLVALPFLGAVYNHVRIFLRRKMGAAEDDRDHSKEG